MGTGFGLRFVPQYDLIDQTSLDAQFTRAAWLFKLEAMTRSGHGDRFAAVTGGFECTFFQLAGGRTDLGLLAEYHYDGRDRDRARATVFDRDLFAGARLTLNDENDTNVLVGAIVDQRNQSTLAGIEAERRFGDTWKIELEARLFANVDSGEPDAGIRDDDFLTLRLSRFF